MDLSERDESVTDYTSYASKLCSIAVKIAYHVVVVTLFSLFYLLFDAESFSGIDPERDVGGERWFTRFYFSSTVMSTIGFGDVSPASIGLRVLVCFQQLVVVAEIVMLFQPSNAAPREMLTCKTRPKVVMLPLPM